MHNLKVGDFVKHSSQDSSHYGAICQVVDMKATAIRLKIIRPGKNQSFIWMGSGREIGIFYPHNFNGAFPRFVKTEGPIEDYNPVLEKIKSLQTRFKTKSLPKTKQKALPFPQ